MTIDLYSENLEITDSLKDYVTQRIRLLDKYVQAFEKDEPLLMKVELSRSTHHHNKGPVFYAELTTVIFGTTLRIEQYEEDARVAIDKAKDRMKVELRRFKEKTQQKRR